MAETPSNPGNPVRPVTPVFLQKSTEEKRPPSPFPTIPDITTDPDVLEEEIKSFKRGKTPEPEETAARPLSPFPHIPDLSLNPEIIEKDLEAIRNSPIPRDFDVVEALAEEEIQLGDIEDASGPFPKIPDLSRSTALTYAPKPFYKPTRKYAPVSLTGKKYPLIPNPSFPQIKPEPKLPEKPEEPEFMLADLDAKVVERPFTPETNIRSLQTEMFERQGHFTMSGSSSPYPVYIPQESGEIETLKVAETIESDSKADADGSISEFESKIGPDGLRKTPRRVKPKEDSVEEEEPSEIKTILDKMKKVRQGGGCRSGIEMLEGDSDIQVESTSQNTDVEMRAKEMEREEIHVDSMEKKENMIFEKFDVAEAKIRENNAKAKMVAEEMKESIDRKQFDAVEVKINEKNPKQSVKEEKFEETKRFEDVTKHVEGYRKEEHIKTEESEGYVRESEKKSYLKDATSHLEDYRKEESMRFARIHDNTQETVGEMRREQKSFQVQQSDNVKTHQEDYRKEQRIAMEKSERNTKATVQEMKQEQKSVQFVESEDRATVAHLQDYSTQQRFMEDNREMRFGGSKQTEEISFRPMGDEKKMENVMQFGRKEIEESKQESSFRKSKSNPPPERENKQIDAPRRNRKPPETIIGARPLFGALDINEEFKKAIDRKQSYHQQKKGKESAPSGKDISKMSTQANECETATVERIQLSENEEVEKIYYQAQREYDIDYQTVQEEVVVPSFTTNVKCYTKLNDGRTIYDTLPPKISIEIHPPQNFAYDNVEQVGRTEQEEYSQEIHRSQKMMSFTKEDYIRNMISEQKHSLKNVDLPDQTYNGVEVDEEYRKIPVKSLIRSFEQSTMPPLRVKQIRDPLPDVVEKLAHCPSQSDVSKYAASSSKEKRYLQQAEKDFDNLYYVANEKTQSFNHDENSSFRKYRAEVEVDASHHQEESRREISSGVAGKELRICGLVHVVWSC